ncbi:3-oxosteroid 1-dehydrogenase [Ochrobactrum quorumnocens]|uniref:3-oxosteroid 1-dehydrogenase n=1 Tax=Ochrobactrum quorumnocens TaxID=271865 RepID=A0A248UDG4_9HYPH|nr:FAD-dependent oxidoreductase [[Ochrobactrum] quorumnocens]ASV84863.1 3-oxosteroid 1-dehydrogenase [[Ochrobactrum] quorumnocens]
MYQNQHECVFDVVIAGSGAAGLTAAVTAAERGFSVLVLESTDKWGGTSAISGGGVWIPNTRPAREKGLKDSREEALTYLQELVGDHGPATSQPRLETFVDRGPEMVDYLERLGFPWVSIPRYPDYHPEKPGGKIGRTLEAALFNGKKLGKWLKTLRTSDAMPPVEFATTLAPNMLLVTHSLKGFSTAIRVMMLNAFWRGTGRTPLSRGKSLVAGLWTIAEKHGAELWLNAPYERILFDEDRAVGLEVSREGKRIVVKARKAVVLATGGFSLNAGLRRKYHNLPTVHSVAPTGLDGKAIEDGFTIGADMGLMDTAWWMPTVLDQEGGSDMLAIERNMPHSIMVNEDSRRFVNEAADYLTVGGIIWGMNRDRESPVWLVADSRYRKNYLFNKYPGGITPKKLLESGYFIKADTLDALARKCSLPVAALKEEITRFNGFVENNYDEAFQRGVSAFDKYYGDPALPNPNLGKIEKGPFWAIRIYPGDIGTKGGMITDAVGRVLRNGKPIIGLYASGNTTASMMGTSYPGAGATIGPAMVFSYCAMQSLPK